jgi:apolipoprotein D and lipocalin family protein
MNAHQSVTKLDLVNLRFWGNISVFWSLAFNSCFAQSNAHHFWPKEIEMALLRFKVLFVGILFVQSSWASEPLVTVPKVDISRYLGRWYEIASLPQRFQRDCFAVTADYSLREDGDIAVLNSCQKGAVDGPLKTAKGKAWAVDSTNAKLKVQFFWPFRGDYWIIELGDNYEYAVVGNPSREYLWILSRTPAMDASLYDELVSKIADKHKYTNLDKLKKMIQK